MTRPSVKRTAIVNGQPVEYEVAPYTRTEEVISNGVRYEVTHTETTTTMRPIGTVPIAAERIVTVETGRTSCCDAYSTIGQDDGVEYCKACGCSITGYR